VKDALASSVLIRSLATTPYEPVALEGLWQGAPVSIVYRPSSIVTPETKLMFSQ
jgi:hypothetical protein